MVRPAGSDPTTRRVVKAPLGLGLYAQLLGHLCIGWFHEHGAIVKDDSGDDLLPVVEFLNNPGTFRVLTYVNTFIVNALLSQELLGLFAIWALGIAVGFDVGVGHYSSPTFNSGVKPYALDAG